MQTRERDSKKILNGLDAKEYVKYFKRAVGNAPKLYRKYSKDRYIELLQIIESESNDSSLSELDLWDAIEKHAKEVYAAKYLPRFIVQDHLDQILQCILKLFPRKELEKNLIQSLKETQNEVLHKIESFKVNNTELQTQNATFQVVNASLTAANQLAATAKNGLTEKMSELESRYQKALAGKLQSDQKTTLTSEKTDTNIDDDTQRLIKENLDLMERLNLKSDTINRLKELNKRYKNKNTALKKQLAEKNAEIINLKESVAKKISSENNDDQSNTYKKNKFRHF
jgi:hypothetical protein